MSEATTLHGERYLSARASSGRLAKFITEDLVYLDYTETVRWYRHTVPAMDRADRALLGCNDRYFLLTSLLGRKDALHPWLFARCREVEAAPDDHLDLWARFHYKSTIGTFAGCVQEVMRDPEVTICILSCTKAIADAFLLQIQQEFEKNEELQRVYSDVLWANPKQEASRWSRQKGIVVRRKSNPKEGTIEAWGLIDGQPTSRHYRLLVYDDVVTQDLVGNPERIRTVTERWELSDNLGTHGSTRKWHFGTRYSFGDTYGVILERNTLKERRYPATENGKIDGELVLLSPERWTKIKDAQRSTLNAQMLQNPLAGKEQVFQPSWFKTYEIRPTILNVYIMVDPSKGKTKKSDRTGISVVGVDVAGNRYLLDGYRHRMALSERWQVVKELHRKWTAATGVQTVRVGWERYGKDAEIEALELLMDRDKYQFEIIELNTVTDGEQSKRHRVDRLEPDFRHGRFFLPACVHYPMPSRKDPGRMVSTSTWTVKDEKIVYSGLEGPTRAQALCIARGETYRVPQPIKRLDEEREAYDLTRALIEEMMFFPFAPKDDLVDATSRLYDMQPVPPVQYETRNAEVPVYEDS